MSSPIVYPDHESPAYADSPAGAGQPLHIEEYGQSYVYVDPDDPTKGVYTDETSLHPGKYLLGMTMTRIYILLSKMIESMQNVAVVQSERLNFLTEWQNAYNAKLNSVHSFVQGNGDIGSLSGTGSEASNSRSDLNNANSNYTEQMKANNGIVSDDAKAMQTVINQTQDNVNKASDMATSLIQQFQTIMSSIFR